MITEVMERMVRYNAAAIYQINHALKVTSFAVLIARMEGCDVKTVERVGIAGVLHDIGIREAAVKHGSTAGKYQEIEGPPVAAALMSDLPIPEATKERICFIVGHHHTLSAVDDLDFQILVEADYLVNAYEEELSPAAMRSVRRKVFRTASGGALFDSMYAEALKVDGDRGHCDTQASSP